MLYDGSAVNQISPRMFDAGHWNSLDGTPETATGGRGTVVFIRHDGQDWALRHYRRGGLPGRLLSDQFLYLGEPATRSFREFRLLQELYRMGLPVPRPVAAHYQRAGAIYRADLITSRIANARPLSQLLLRDEFPADSWPAVGKLLRRFHEAGVFHADLNAHNILMDDAGEFYLLDFDRGRIRPHGIWISSNLKRLSRSLRKITGNAARFGPQGDAWRHLMAGYDK
jgi:3-deoxy-D-manno-octulosonic acid kinase